MATVTALWLCGLPSALAQSEDWLVLPTTVDDQASWMEPTVGKLSRELRRQGVGVWSSERAVSDFEKGGSASPPVVSDQEVEAWAARSLQALRTLASGDFEAALADLEEAQAFSWRALVTLNLNPARAQAVLDTCLYLVRARSAAGEEQAATLQAQECVRLVPSGEPTRQMHPPGVLELYEAAALPGPARVSTLLVESQPSQCPLRVNGALVGETPSDVTDLYPGQYQIQVECEPGREGRVHTVEVPRGSTSLFVSDRFDRAVQSAPLLHLRYEQAPDSLQLARDARQLARALPAAAVIIASTPQAGILELRVVTLTQREPVLVRITSSATGPRAPAVVDATATLLAGQCRDLTGARPVPIDCRTGETLPSGKGKAGTKDSGVRPPHGQFISGVTLASVGTASLLAGYGLLIARKRSGDNWISDPSSLEAQDQWLSLGTGLLITGPVGGGLLVAAMPLALPYQRKTPWWAWMSGGLGLVAVAGSIASAATAAPKPPQSCTVSGPDPTPCVNRGRDTNRAVMLGATAAPLLTVPLVYLFRRSDKKLDGTLVPSAIASRQGGAVMIQGMF